MTMQLLSVLAARGGLILRLSQQRRRSHRTLMKIAEFSWRNHLDDDGLVRSGSVVRRRTTSTCSSTVVPIHTTATTTTTTTPTNNNNNQYSTKPNIPSSSSTSSSTSSTSSSTSASSSVLQSEINKAGFQIFQHVSDNGYVLWRPPPPPHWLFREQQQHGYYTNLSKITSAKEITDCIVPDGKPAKLVLSNSSIQLLLPRQFITDLAPVEYANKFPYGQHEIASLHVAVKDRGVDLVNNIDFCFGGSTLGMLAKRRDNNTQKPYMISRIPGTRRAILIVNKNEYVANLSAIGYQFERLMTGKDSLVAAQQGKQHGDMAADSVDHLQVMQVGKYRVLFLAETDAMDPMDGTNTPVEVKLSNPRYSSYWGTKVMFQMMSSGSTKICHGIKDNDKDGQLVSVSLRSLSNVADEALFLTSSGSGSSSTSVSAVHELEENILKGMDSIVSEINKASSSSSSSSSLDGDNSSPPVFQIFFANDKTLKLLPVSGEGAAILPPSRIVRELVVN